MTDFVERGEKGMRVKRKVAPAVPEPKLQNQVN